MKSCASRGPREMALFRYRAFDNAGHVGEGEVEAINEAAARDTLWRRDLTPLEIAPVSQGDRAWRPRRRGRISLRELTVFTREFATLEDADIPLDDALRILIAQAGGAAVRDVAQGILDDALDGVGLAEAMRRRPEAFPSEYVHVVQAGETAGALGPALSQLAELLERRRDLRARIQSALVYPLILIVLALFSVGVIVSVLVPNVAPIFADAGKPMPAGVRVIMTAHANWPVIVGLLSSLALAAILVARAAAANENLAVALSRRALEAPIAGAWIARRDFARFARTLGSLLRAGAPLLIGLEAARNTISNVALRADLARVTEQARNGASLSRALDEAPQTPELALRMIRVGEEAGRLAVMLTRVADTFETEIQQTIDRWMNLLTPFLTVSIAALVGGLIVSVMSAILSINEIAIR